MYLIKHDLKWDRLGASAGEMGILFTSMSIMSGILWAKPVWGIWWTWDARLTLQFLLGLIFLSYLMLRAYLPEREKKAALGGVFGVLAMVDVPFNYLSIRWWRTQHPQPVILGGGLDTDMWKVMIVSFLAFAAYMRICLTGAWPSLALKRKSSTWNTQSSPMTNPFVAYSLVFVILFIFTWLLISRLTRLEKKLDELKQRLKEKP